VSQAGSVSQGDWVYYQIDASTSDTDITVELTNLSADVDLYVLAGFQPTLNNYDTAETCSLQNSGDTTWYIGVHGYRSGNYTVKATLSGGGGQITLEAT
jgi:hypothetical protein